MNPTNQSLYAMLKASRIAFAYAVGFSCIVNLLMLTVPIYMLQVFDRVIPSQSHETLLYLTVIAILAIMVMSLLDIARSQLLTQVSRWIDNKLSPPALEKSLDHTLQGGTYGAQSLVDITSIRQFLSSPSVYAFFDAPWVFIFLTVIFLLNFYLGLLATLGAILLFALAVLNEIVSRKPLQQANAMYIKNQDTIRDSIKNAEVIQAMGMMSNIFNTWMHHNESVIGLQCAASHRSNIVLGCSKFIRMTLQILILGIGAYLVVKGELTSGGMIAGSIIMGRALAPIEQSIGAWKQAIGALQAAKRLDHYLSYAQTRPSSITLPKPKGKLDVTSIFYVPPGEKLPVVQAIQFSLAPGESLGIIGPSGSGKSTLARLLVGIWQPSQGKVCLDGANLYEWNRQDIGHHVGYLSQNCALFNGSVKENIARMGEINDEKIIEAATFVFAHELILQFQHGYETHIGSYQLSGGQKQRIALARAFYGLPNFVVLDEPETSLDQEGIAALEQLFKRTKDAKMTLVVVTQRPQLLHYFDKVLVMNKGRMARFGRYDEIIKE